MLMSKEDHQFLKTTRKHRQGQVLRARSGVFFAQVLADVISIEQRRVAELNRRIPDVCLQDIQAA